MLEAGIINRRQQRAKNTMTPEIKRHAQGGVSSDVVSGLAIAALGAFPVRACLIDLPLGRGLRWGPATFRSASVSCWQFSGPRLP